MNLIFSLPTISSTIKINMPNLTKQETPKYISEIKEHHSQINVNYEWHEQHFQTYQNKLYSQ